MSGTASLTPLLGAFIADTFAGRISIGWGVGFGVLVAMLISIVVFIIGYPLYRNLDPAGSPFTRLLQVCVAAYKKRKLEMILGQSSNSNRGRQSEISQSMEAKHSPSRRRTKISHKNGTNMGIRDHLDHSIRPTTRLPQCYAPLPSMTAFLSLARRLTGLGQGISFLTRINWLLHFCHNTLVAGLLIKRKEAALAHGLMNKSKAIVPISVFWLVPQYCLHGVAEAFMSIGHLEFFYDQAPESMRSTATALFWTAISAGNYLSTLLVSLVHKFTTGPGGTNWLPDNNLNKEVEYFYWLITILQVVNLIYYLFCARFYISLFTWNKTEDLESKKDELNL
ncbi:hypothetical protein HAX54_030929 [Datura stramonium]|uniref:Uncharacterized protein n=1 Tax=Datura stramonium TaxID=4076 RepID=A0ABS8SBK5_DATST|nr:hypothetical protein [Datura stramonium]